MVQEVAVMKVYGRCRVQIPKQIRVMLDIKDGDRVLWYINDRGEVCLKKVRV